MLGLNAWLVLVVVPLVLGPSLTNGAALIAAALAPACLAIGLWGHSSLFS